MSAEQFIKSDLAQKLGVSSVLMAATYLVWGQLNVHIDGRLNNQDQRIAAMQTENVFMRDYIVQEQVQRKTWFTTIERHLTDMKKSRAAASGK